jgi:hypothetical protein
MQSLAWAVVTLLLGACSAVYSPAPFGQAPIAIDPADWDGQWLHPFGFVVIETADAERGILDVLYTEDTEARFFQVHLLKAGDWTFGSFREQNGEAAHSAPGKALGEQPAVAESAPDGGAPGRFLWFRVEHKDDYLILWMPDVERFRQRVVNGDLPGQVERSDQGIEGDVLLGPLTPEHYRMIAGGSPGPLLNREDPLPLIRIRR